MLLWPTRRCVTRTPKCGHWSSPGGWLVFTAAAVGIGIHDGRRVYKIEKGGPDSTHELEQIAALHQLGGLSEVFVGSRGGFVSKTALFLGHCEEGLVRYEADFAPRGYRWGEIASVCQEVSHNVDNGTYKRTDFKYVLDFEDGTTLRIRGSYRDPQLGRGDAQQAAYRCSTLFQQASQLVTVRLLPGARDTLAHSATIDFDGIVVSADKLRYQGADTPWSAIGAAYIKDGFLTFPHLERRSPVVKKKLAGTIPNLPLLLALSNELRQSASRGSRGGLQP